MVKAGDREDLKWGKQKAKQEVAKLVNSMLASTTLEADPSIFNNPDPVIRIDSEIDAEKEEEGAKPTIVESGVVDAEEIKKEDLHVSFNLPNWR